jgi:Fic family protein
MKNIPLNQQIILSVFLEKGSLSSSVVHSELITRGSEVSLVTIKRELALMKAENLLESSGAGRSVEYQITSLGRLISSVNAGTYCLTEPDKRYGQSKYNFDLFGAVQEDLFTAEENKILRDFTNKYIERTKDLPEAIKKKELERFIIELSWKSSKIEGNTYTLLDTEKLILEGVEAVGHDRKETAMILNHKEAFKFILANISKFKEFNRTNIEEVHKILIRDLNINNGLRSKPVGVTGSLYQPLDNIHQVAEAVDSLSKAIAITDNPYLKALLAIVGISYVQPFEDGNKRTARLIGNAILLAHNCAPLSYRSVDENSYREAILVFYELNSLIPFKKMFIEQYIFSAENYLVR